MNILARFLRFVFWVLIFSWGLKLIGRVAGWALRRAVNPEQHAGGANGAEWTGTQPSGTQPGATRSAAGRTADAATGQSEPAARQLVRDPVCGMHIAEVLAIPLRERGELLHFCSAECRDKYASGLLRQAANG
jgi:YHS domain-containing protein